MRRSGVYKWIAICCLFLFLMLQYLMIVRSYEIKRSQLFQKEKRDIKVVYDRHILNDKMFSGGQELVDSTLMPHLNRLKCYHRENRIAFANLRDSIAGQLLSKLRDNPAIDSLFEAIRSEVHLDKGFGYALVLRDVSVTFDAKDFIPIIDFSENQFIRIGGEPNFIEKDNLVSAMAIAANNKMSNRVAFTLYVGNINTKYSVIKSIFPLLLLSGCCITGIVGLYWVTYNNWMKQKRMAEMASDFINNVTHEFNTPLTTIRIALSNIAVKVSEEEKVKISPILETMGRQIKRLDRLVNKAIDLSVFNKEKVILEQRYLSVLMDQFRQDIVILTSEYTKIYILMDKQVSPAKVLLHPFMFVTMLNNLVENGLKYNNEKLKHIHIHLKYSAANELLLIVQDNGIGIAENQLQHIFTKGYRGKLHSSSDGLGLGLFFVQEVIRIHGWKIEVKSTVEQGTKFIIYIPTL